MKQVLVQSVQTAPDSPRYGQVLDPEDFMKSQRFAQEHLDAVVRAFLTGGAPSALVHGFNRQLIGGLRILVQSPGWVFTPSGASYSMTQASTTLTLNPADAALSRLDVVCARLDTSAPAYIDYRPFCQIRTLSERLAGNAPYPPTQFNQPGELHNRAVLVIHTGIPALAPIVPPYPENELPLFFVRIAALKTQLALADVVDYPNRIESLFSIIAKLAAFNSRITALEIAADFQ
ncbi:MAG: hypothetical protein MSG64_07585 [Pyrinomonadaceae bacterium MAG19_C2-C3]|nr:hypothetical protein [Pyrinomonadaceae bacterium MAG19_C2-C3]